MSVISLLVGVHDLPTRVPCRAPVSSHTHRHLQPEAPWHHQKARSVILTKIKYVKVSKGIPGSGFQVELETRFNAQARD